MYKKLLNVKNIFIEIIKSENMVFEIRILEEVDNNIYYKYNSNIDSNEHFNVNIIQKHIIRHPKHRKELKNLIYFFIKQSSGLIFSHITFKSRLKLRFFHKPSNKQQ